MNWRAVVHHTNLLIAALMVLFSSVVVLRVYYHVKPFTPRAVRLVVRQALVNRQRRRATGVWPILEKAGQPPEHWKGWPGARKFALVLTHDVESEAGLKRVKDLAQLEMSMGLRSCFNFVPEGTYSVPKELLRWLTEQGFEVGVHDHRHDGNLYRSWSRFRASAQRINYFLKQWQAVGFRSGFMFRNLGWIGNLDVLYDSSTFDTDPFEPQPDGVETIFPFWVRAVEGRGYVELPYTLAQDSTLFILMKEPTSEIWHRKLDWIASRGGMALMNVHPDYMTFGKSPTKYEYSAEIYQKFLHAVQQKYQDQYWHALPRDVAAFCRQAIDQSQPCISADSPDCRLA